MVYSKFKVMFNLTELIFYNNFISSSILFGEKLKKIFFLFAEIIPLARLPVNVFMNSFESWKITYAILNFVVYIVPYFYPSIFDGQLLLLKCDKFFLVRYFSWCHSSIHSYQI